MAMIRWVLRVLGALLGLAVLFLASQYAASESGEVVVLRTNDAAGGVRETRLWVVEHAGRPWLRAGNAGTGWFVRLQADPDAEMVRSGETLPVRAVPVPEERDRINDLMNEKYGFADGYICFFLPRERKIPVRLDPR
jgi:hypothetical protein